MSQIVIKRRVISSCNFCCKRTMEANNNLLAKPSDYRSISRHLLLAFRSSHMCNGCKYIAHWGPYLMHDYIKKKKKNYWNHFCAEKDRIRNGNQNHTGLLVNVVICIHLCIVQIRNFNFSFETFQFVLLILACVLYLLL